MKKFTLKKRAVDLAERLDRTGPRIMPGDIVTVSGFYPARRGPEFGFVIAVQDPRHVTVMWSHPPRVVDVSLFAPTVGLSMLETISSIILDVKIPVPWNC